MGFRWTRRHRLIGPGGVAARDRGYVWLVGMALACIDFHGSLILMDSYWVGLALSPPSPAYASLRARGPFTSYSTFAIPRGSYGYVWLVGMASVSVDFQGFVPYQGRSAGVDLPLVRVSIPFGAGDEPS